MKDTIILCSNNKVKFNALQLVFKDHEIVSMIGENKLRPPQPVSYYSGITCAEERIKEVLEKNKNVSVKYIIAIESYIDHDNSTWWDAPAIVITDDKGKVIIKSPPWNKDDRCSNIVSEFYIKKTMSNCDVSKLGWSITVGDIIHKLNSHIPPDDWQEYLSRESRKNSIIIALQNTLKLLDIYNKLQGEICIYDNFPKKNIYFRDVNPIFENSELFNTLIKFMSNWIPDSVTHIVGIESRGFIMGSAIAFYKNKGFVPIRKKNKLPGEIYNMKYQKEYGYDCLEIQRDSLDDSCNVVIVDDIIATGGSAKAASDLVKLCGATISNLLFIDAVPELLHEATKKLNDIPFTILL